MRLWSNQENKAVIEAEFVNLVDDKVELRKVDGSALQVPLAQLSLNDRKFVQGRVTVERVAGVPSDLPPGESIASARPTAASVELPPAISIHGKPPDPNAPSPVFRSWHNVALSKKVRASFVSLIRGELKLQDERLKGVRINWPMAELSDEDKAHVQSMVGEDYYLQHKDPRP